LLAALQFQMALRLWAFSSLMQEFTSY